MVLIRKCPGGLIARIARSLCPSGGLLSAEDRSNVLDAVFELISRYAALISIVMSAGDQCLVDAQPVGARRTLVSFADHAKEIYCCIP
jgi:hypothetical protein